MFAVAMKRPAAAKRKLQEIAPAEKPVEDLRGRGRKITINYDRERERERERKKERD